MNEKIKVFSIEENGITYTYYNVTRKSFFYVDSDHVIAFQLNEDARLFVLDVNCPNIDASADIMKDFFACDEIKVNAK